MKTYTASGKEKEGWKETSKLKISKELNNTLAEVWEMRPMWLKVCFQVSGGKAAESSRWQQVGKLALWSGCNSRPQRTVQAHSPPAAQPLARPPLLLLEPQLRSLLFSFQASARLPLFGRPHSQDPAQPAAPAVPTKGGKWNSRRGFPSLRSWDVLPTASPDLLGNS